MQDVDVVVIGAGPAGSAASIELARAGRDVVVLDKATFPRDKCCGDGLTTGALRHLAALGVGAADVASWQVVDACWIRSPSGRTVRYPFPPDRVYGAVARRADLDAALVDAARAAGAKVHDGHAVRALRWSPTHVTVEGDGLEPLRARYVVGADGAWSPVRKLVGVAEPGYRGDWHAFRQYLRAPGAAARQMWVWFEPDLLPGYAWSFPLPGGIANVGFGILRAPGVSAGVMAELWPRLLAAPHVRDVLADATPEAPPKTWPIPARLPVTRLSAVGGRVLFAGDAARAADPMTGEGIAQGLETGRLAAAVIGWAGPDRPAAAAERYRTILRRGMVVDHRLAGALSRCLATPAGVRGAVRLSGATAWTRRNFARWLFEDYPRALLATPHRWGPGALHAATRVAS